MSKRTNEANNCSTTSTKIMKSDPETEISSLPDETIAEIFSKFNEIEDLRSCMLLSTRFRELAFKSPDVMRNFIIKLPDHEISYRNHTFEFLQNYGLGIKNIDLEMDYVVAILKKTPNVEGLTLNSDIFEEIQYKSEENVDLPKLKYLNIAGAVDYFISCLKDIYKLESLIIFFNRDKNAQSLTDFITQQKNLKYFRFVFTEFNELANVFPIRDISVECQFQLTEFIYNCDDYNPHLLRFLEVQLKTLKELNINSNINFELLDVIFNNGKNLECLTLNTSDTDLESFLFSANYPNWVLPNVKFFSTMEPSPSEFVQIFKRFPKVDSISIKELTRPVALTLPQLDTLHIAYLDCRIMSNLKMLKLKNLIFHNISNLEFLEKFSENVPHLERIAYNSKDEENLDFLKFSPRLQKVEYRIGRPAHFQILADYHKHIVYRNRAGLKNLDIIERIFPDFEIVEDKIELSKSLFASYYAL